MVQADRKPLYNKVKMFVSISLATKERNNMHKNLLSQGSGTYFAVIFVVVFTLAKLFNVAFNKIFTNVLSTSDMGKYAIFLTATATILTYASLGFPTALTRYTIAYKNKGKINQLKDLVFTGFLMFFVAEILIVSTLVILYYRLDFLPWFLNVEPYIYTLLIIGGIAIAQVFSTICYSIASALQNSRYYAIPIITRALFHIPFGILFVIFLKLGVFGLILGLFVSELLVAFYSLFRIVKDLGIGSFSWKELKSIFSYSSPIYFYSICFTSFNLLVLLFVDYVFIDTGKEIIALYRYGALSIINLLLIAGNIFGLVYRPILYKYFEKKKYKEMELLTVTTMKMFCIPIFGIGILLFAFSPLLVKLFSNASYLPSIPIIPILLFAAIFEYLLQIMVYGHTLFYKTYWSAVGGIISIMISGIVGYFVIPLTGLIGIGIVYLVFRILNFLIMFSISQHYFKVQYDPMVILKLVVSVLSSIGIGVIFFLWVFGPEYEYSIILSFVISAFCYFGLILVLRIIKKKDIDFVKMIIQNFRKMRSIER